MSAKNKTLAKEWVDRAMSDFKYAKAGEKETKQHHITCFLCHQSVEKSLKGLTVLTGGVPKKTHNLGLLASVLVGEYKSLVSIQSDIRKLDKYYIPARYPDDMSFEFKKEDAEIALTTTKNVIDIAIAEIV